MVPLSAGLVDTSSGETVSALFGLFHSNGNNQMKHHDLPGAEFIWMNESEDISKNAGISWHLMVHISRYFLKLVGPYRCKTHSTGHRV